MNKISLTLQFGDDKDPVNIEKNVANDDFLNSLEQAIEEVRNDSNESINEELNALKEQAGSDKNAFKKIKIK